MIVFKVIALCIYFSNVNGRALKASNSCGYESCHPVKEGFINVHIVPHTHDDVGWLKTPDQYYYGAKTNYQNAGVQHILSTVVDSLSKDDSRRFIYVETAFFWKWWTNQNDKIKAKVTDFVNNGQLEFISGGWSMNDEAACHYQSIIDQMTWGLRKLNDTFGECGRPKIGWQIDPFGHSREMANIFSQLGFDGLLLGRIDYQDKNYRFQTKTAEVVWRGSDSLGESTDIFSGVMYNTYSPPPGFCWDILCGDEPFIDDKKSFEYNVDARVNDFLDYIQNVSKVYATSNIIITMGNDFNYQDAESWFVNLDKLIKYVNERQAAGSKFNLIYSTPSCYIKAIYDETKGKSWLLKKDDYFPYSSDPHAFWTGYFTSRPAIKRYERFSNNFLQVCKQLFTLANIGSENEEYLNSLREAMGVMQHHDAITGTEKQHVANDYARHLAQANDECEIITTAAISKLARTSLESDQLSVVTCPLTNISQCAFTEASESFVTILYNPLSKNVSKVIRLPVAGTAYSVRDSQGNELTSQIVPIADFILNIPGRKSNALNELVFVAENIPALGWKSYYIQLKQGNNVIVPVNSFEISQQKVKLTIDETTGLLSKIDINNASLDVTQNFFIYKGFVGNNEVFENRSSGAYIFRPTGPSKKVSEKTNYRVYTGNLISEIHQTFNDYIHQIIRINNIDNLVEFDWVVGPIPTNERNGIEVVTKFSTSLKSNSTFYTDSNGKQMLKRVRNFRPTFNSSILEPVAGNYYPVVSKISIKDDNMELAVLSDRAQGGTSLEDGEIELMVHRNCLHDDAFGVGEPLNETAFGKGLVVRGSHYLTFGNLKDSAAANERDIAQRKLLDVWTFFSPAKKLSFKEFRSQNLMEFSGLIRALPENIQILTLEPWKESSILLRLEHIFDKDEDSTLSKSVSVNLQDLFSSFKITSVQETTLGGNQWLEENDRLKFNTNGITLEDLVSSTYSDYEFNPEIMSNRIAKHAVININENFEFILNPSQIRSFIIEIERN